MYIRNPDKRADTPKEIGRYKQDRLRGNDQRYFPTILEPSPMTLETLIFERTLKSGSLKRLFRLDTAEKPEKENIQDVEINLVKKQSWAYDRRTRRRV